MTYVCKQCNYSTDRLSSYKKHCQTKKHKSNEVSNENGATFGWVKNTKNLVKNTKQYFCEYCQKSLYDKRNLIKHLKICKEKPKKSVESKDQIIEKLMMENRKKDEAILKNNKEKDKLKDDLLKANHKITDLETQVNENKGDITVNNYNMFYVIKNFTNAHNIEDIMMPKLTDKEIKCIEDRGAVGGTYQLIKNRCIEDIDLPDRPFHCIDGARDKYLMRSENNWSIDSMGNQILDVVFPKVRPLYDLTVEDTCKLTHNAEQLTDLENGRKKIIKELNNDAILKNNMRIINDKSTVKK